MADVIAMYKVVDVKTTEADVIACYILFYGWCYCQCVCGRCDNHMLQYEEMFVNGWCYCLFYFILLADVIANISMADVVTTYYSTK